MALDKDKDFLRFQNLQKRNSLNNREISEKSALIQEKLFSLQEFKSAKKIFFYVGIKNEVQTKQMILDALALGKIVSVPLSDFEKKEIKPIQIKSLSGLEEKKFGLLEPKQAINGIPAEEIDLIIVPGIAFDLQGNHLGSGSGFFDKFLGKTKKSAQKIGLAFECNIEERIPSSAHDIKMNKIITEEKIISV